MMYNAGGYPKRRISSTLPGPLAEAARRYAVEKQLTTETTDGLGFVLRQAVRRLLIQYGDYSAAELDGRAPLHDDLQYGYEQKTECGEPQGAQHGE